MDLIFLWLVGGVAGLLLAAAGVAGWEQLRRSVRPQEEFTSATPRAVKVDVRLDRLATQPVPLASTPESAAIRPEGDLAQRRAALDQVLERLAHPAGPEQAPVAHDNPLYWADTAPMVGPGLAEPPDGAAADGPREFSNSQPP